MNLFFKQRMKLAFLSALLKNKFQMRPLPRDASLQYLTKQSFQKGLAANEDPDGFKYLV